MQKVLHLVWPTIEFDHLASLKYVLASAVKHQRKLFKQICSLSTFNYIVDLAYTTEAVSKVQNGLVQIFAFLVDFFAYVDELLEQDLLLPHEIAHFCSPHNVRLHNRNVCRAWKSHKILKLSGLLDLSTSFDRLFPLFHVLDFDEIAEKRICL